MIGSLTYPRKVLRGLFDRGWSPQTLPSISKGWLEMIHKLRKNGVCPDEAAGLLDRALEGDQTAIQAIDKQSRFFGTMFFGTPEWRAENPHLCFQK